MTAAHDSRTFFLDGPVGRLEAILWTPTTAESTTRQTHWAPRFTAVVCHPHPLFGGTMHNKVVYQTAKSLAGLGMPVLRFNFRGTGLSEGGHDRGRGEVDDVRAALDFLATEFPGVFESPSSRQSSNPGQATDSGQFPKGGQVSNSGLLLAGFSFGSWVGLRAGCVDARVARLIGLGIPVNNCDFSFLADCAKPKLFVHGENDEHGAIAKVREVVAGLSGDNSLVVVPGVDHFFTGKLNQLDHAITNWLTPVLRARFL